MFGSALKRFAVAIAAIAVILAPALGQSFGAPLDLVKAIYQPMLAGAWHPDEQVFFSSATRARWDALVARDPNGLGFSPLVDGQDADLSAFSIVHEDIGGDFAQIAVRFSNFGEPRTLSFDLVREPDGWLVDDITRTDGDYPWRLSDMLVP